MLLFYCLKIRILHLFGSQSHRLYCLLSKPGCCFSPVRHWKSIAKWHISHHALKWQCLPWISIYYVTVLKTCFLIFLFIITIYTSGEISVTSQYIIAVVTLRKKKNDLVKNFIFSFQKFSLLDEVKRKWIRSCK